MTTKTFKKLPEIGPRLSGNGGVYCTVNYVGKGLTGAEKQKTTAMKTYGCWGFFYDKSRAKGTLGVDMSTVTEITYYLTTGQVKGIKHVPDDLCEQYLQLLQAAGVAQWFTKVPTTKAEYETVGCTISTAYPGAMVIGLLEMYRDLYYHPNYITHAVDLWVNHGMTPGASLLLPRALRLGAALPNADALHFASSFSHSTKWRGYRNYRSDLFSERHIMKCIEVWKKPPMRQNPDFSGVFDFFACGYSKEMRNRIELPIGADKTHVHLLTPAAAQKRHDSCNYNDTYKMCLTQQDLEKAAEVFNLTYDRCH